MSGIDHTHDPDATCWVAGADDHPDFPVQNLPLGVFAPDGGADRIGTAIGDRIVDVSALSAAGLLPGTLADTLDQPTLNALFARPAQDRRALRHALFALLTDRGQAGAVTPHLHAADACTMALPFRIGDYTDFYVGIHHATHIGRQFRPDAPLLPNYKHIPIGYHGRASSVRVSGTPLVRPQGQRKAADADAPDFGPCRRLDHELELGVWIAGENALGDTVPISTAWDRIGGFCLLNDWSARDIQAWEYQPLGPFLAKNFLTSVSPWVITADAMAPFRQPQPPRPAGDPAPLPYLADTGDAERGALSVTLDVQLRTAAMAAAGLAPHPISRVTADRMYWTVAQMVAHHGSGGCPLLPGDLLGTGTISGPEPGSFGSLMEASQGGRTPIPLPGGEVRSFLEDGDTLILSARAEAEGVRTIGFGACSGTVLPARPA